MNLGKHFSENKSMTNFRLVRKSFGYVYLMIFLCFVSVSNALAWDPIRDLTGKRIKDHLKSAERDLKNLPKSWGSCVARPDRCAKKEMRRLGYRVLWPVIERYKHHLFNQGNGRWRRLPPHLIQGVQRFYSVNLNGVKYATNINTIHGQAITWENSIFFPREIDLSRRNDLHWMLHELEHTVHYQRKGGYKGLIGQYGLKAIGKMIERGTFSPHDHIDLERSAQRKANNIINEAERAMQRGIVNQIPPPRLGQICRARFGWCHLPQPGPIGFQCFCQANNGRDYGFIN